MRRMITEKEADKLRFIKDDKANGIISLVNDDDAKIALDALAVELGGTVIRYIDPEDDDHVYFEASPEGIYMELPTQDPHNEGYLWNDNGIVKISLG